MREEQGKIERLALEFFEQGLAELPQTGAGVEDDDVGAATDFETGGVAAITQRAGSRGGNRTAHSPKFNLRSHPVGRL